MKKSAYLMIAILAAAASCALAGDGTVGNLSAAAGKISAIDMNKDPGKAGGVLDGFYAGARPAKENGAAAVALGAYGNRTMEQAVKEVCNAAPAKVTASASKVPALGEAGSKSAATVKAGSPYASLETGRKSFSDDLETVLDGGADYVETHGVYNTIHNLLQKDDLPQKPQPDPPAVHG